MAKENKEHEKDYINRYHREKMRSIAFRLSRLSDAELIKIYDSIPNKIEWFRESLLRFEKENKQ